ncbi:tetratricopeptide repeat protein 35 [Nannizzia gypsea CBS 118893]|uniref:ER membrane protein complex subunit 2 n=1 Tax=Arthroderma gypseum (strain ATCC MYA-4604 / CBS 118893) TaxID=535722 RepID=E4UWT4_ARTGP|nr:tetratricopeptide repeat protein 35 [Nannizzia gypsea CBS 118893]EFR01787.1 tetratricopeptide repeat protein 35 [Nannizzia gypsea CBS 118893]
MSTSLLHTQFGLSSSDPQASLRLSQQAPSFLKTQPSRFPSFPFSIFSQRESPELWTSYEQLLAACLRTGDDKSARECLDRLSSRFGEDNERVMGLRGLYDEATAADETALKKVLERYDGILQENPVNVPVLKRRIAVLRSLGRAGEAISSMVEFLDAFPTDAEAWCELSDLYHSQGLSSQSIFCLEEALLILPNAWNLHARLGELLYISTHSPESPEMTLKPLAESVRRFCRSIELCDDYVRGYYGLNLSTTRLLERLGPKSRRDETLPTAETTQKLYDLSVQKLREIVKERCVAGRSPEFNESELITAQALLDRLSKSS